MLRRHEKTFCKKFLYKDILKRRVVVQTRRIGVLYRRAVNIFGRMSYIDVVRRVVLHTFQKRCTQVVLEFCFVNHTFLLKSFGFEFIAL